MYLPSKKDNKMGFSYRMDEGSKFNNWMMQTPQMESKKNVKKNSFNQMTTGKIMLQLRPSLRDVKQSNTVNVTKNPFIGKTMLKLKSKDLQQMSSDLKPEPAYQRYEENKMITEKFMLQKKEPQLTKVREQVLMTNNHNYITTGYRNDNVGKMLLVHRGPPSCPAPYVSEMNPYKAVPTTESHDWSKNVSFGHHLFIQTREVKKNDFGEKHRAPGVNQYMHAHPQLSATRPMKNVFEEPNQAKPLHERRGRKIDTLNDLDQTPNRPSIPFAGRDSPHSPIIKARFSPFKTCQNSSPSWLLAKNVAEFALESPESLKGHGLANYQQKDFFY